DITLDHSFIDLDHGTVKKSNLNTEPESTVGITTAEANFTWLKNSDSESSLSMGFNTLYTIMDFDRISPMTNGHLHTWGLSLAGSYTKNDTEIFYGVTPGISVSSNALKNPELINSDSLQLTTRLTYQKKRNENFTWVYGFISDYRFGDYHLYPLAGICLKPAQGWLLQLVVPDFSIQKKFSNLFNLTFYISPEGNKWHVFSKDLQRNSELTYHAIVTGITAHWSLTPTVELNLDLVKQSSKEFNLVSDDNQLISADADSSMKLKLSGRFLF
ncbi:MAG: hypothetical protein KAI17_26995, partial [Thiotrichaceae bacterium]|nr:hypothetical protein [Thiotrichaceae bacterium]